MQLSTDDLNRYKRQIPIKEIQIKGQERLKCSKIIIIGVGGLGSPVSIYLAASGIGNLTIIDYDKVDLSNLNRQILHSEKNLGKSKIESALENLLSFNSAINIRGINKKIDEKNVVELLSGHDLIIDCLDNFKTRYLINDTACKLNIPLFHGGISECYGQITIIIPNETACLECIMPQNQNSNNNDFSVLGATACIIGGMLAGEVIKYLIGIEKILKGKLLLYDLFNLKYIIVDTLQRDDCPVCGGNKCQ
jgi:molybdopterin-synthase adenylyltransferase